jgi:aryl-alcohol dehydrogenase-like predicted oxidoreductase
MRVGAHRSCSPARSRRVRMVQVARSVPGVVSVVVGQSDIKHVAANTAVLEFPLLTKNQLNSIYKGKTFEERFGIAQDDRRR